MRILFIPRVVFADEHINYSFEDETITATHNGITDTFDFTGLPDGQMEMFDDDGKLTVITELEVVPILSAKREGGFLYVELLNFIGADATEEECFPEWIDSKDYIPPEEEEDTVEEVSADGKDEVEE